MNSTTKERGYCNFLSFIFSIIFLSLSILGGYLVFKTHGIEGILRPVSPWEFIVISLAIYRLTRLFVYDSILQFFRDFFLDQKIEFKEGRKYITYNKPKYHHFGVRRLLADLLGCPWCTGVWLSLGVTFAFYITPFAQPVLILLAAAGASTFFQISMNKIGWHAEKAKLQCQEIEKK